MLYGLNENRERIVATPQAKAVCPVCESPLTAKCGSIRVWHWAHRHQDCDPWAGPETEWHLAWKRVMPSEQTEVVIERDGIKHRADIVTRAGMVVELQQASLSIGEVRERETFYGKMIWLFDVRKQTQKNNLVFQRIPDGLITPGPTPELTELWYEATIGGWLQDTNYDRRRVDDLVRLVWLWPKQYVIHAERPRYLDFGNGNIVRVGKLTPYGGWGYLGTAARFVEWLTS